MIDHHPADTAGPAAMPAPPPATAGTAAAAVPKAEFESVATQLVQDLITQLTQKDAPPSSVGVSAAASLTSSNSNDDTDLTTTAGGSQPPPMTIVTMAPSDEDDAEQAVSSTTAMMSVQTTHSVQLLLGHASLVKLCQLALGMPASPRPRPVVPGETISTTTTTTASVHELALPTPLPLPPHHQTRPPPPPPPPRWSWSSNNSSVGNNSTTTSSSYRSTTKHQHRLPWQQQRRTTASWSSTKTKKLVPPLLPRSSLLVQYGSNYAQRSSQGGGGPAVNTDGSGGGGVTMAAFPRNNGAARDLAQAPSKIQSGAIVDVLAVVVVAAAAAAGQNDAAAPPPKGYWRAVTLSGPKKKGQHVSLWVKVEANWDRAVQRPCLTSLCVLFPDRHEVCPPGFGLVRNQQGHLVNLPLSRDEHHSAAAANNKAQDRCYLCFRRSREGNPLTGLTALTPPQPVPVGYTVLEKSPRGHVASLSARGTFLATRQRLANLETLRPAPLLLHAGNAKSSNKLRAYYATGGTMVPAKVGRLHVMDRSTHTLLSPSSVENRLALIEQSRRKAKKDATTNTTASILTTEGDNSDGNIDVVTTGDFDQGVPSMECEVSPCREVMSTLRQDSNVSDMTGAEPEGGPLGFIPRLQAAVPEAETRLTRRSELAAPLLTACYTRHGGAALQAVESLTALLARTNFFDDDVRVETDDGDGGSSARITLLDLAIQAVCDVATVGTLETSFASCVEFVELATRHAEGQLHTRTIGFVLRFYLFVFYFGVSVPSSTSSTQWPSPLWGSRAARQWNSSDDNNAGDDTDILLDPRTGTSRYLAGGAPQLAALGLKELITLSVVRLGKVAVSDMLERAYNMTRDGPEPSHPADDIVTSMVDMAADNVERANHVQLALHQIHRSGGSELFWYDMMHSVGSGLFGSDSMIGDAARDVYVMLFAILANVVKVASPKASSGKQSADVIHRDRASKMLALELLLHFIGLLSDEQEATAGIRAAKVTGRSTSADTMVYCIRRLVVPCVIANTQAGLKDIHVFRRMLRVMNELWTSPIYRRQCKVELGVLFDHVCVTLLHTGPPQSITSHLLWLDGTATKYFAQFVEVMTEIKRWFSGDPRCIVEFYINFNDEDSENLVGNKDSLQHCHGNIFERLCIALSSIAEKCGEAIGLEIAESRLWTSSSKQDASTSKSRRNTALVLRETALDCLLHISKATAQICAATSGLEFASLIMSWSPVGTVGTAPLSLVDWSEDEQIQRFWQRIIRDSHDPAEKSIASSVILSEPPLEIAFDIAAEKGIKKAIDYMIACQALPATPRDIATFIRLHQRQWSAAGLGQYLGESGIDGTDIDHWNSIRLSYIRAMSFIGMSIVDALRFFSQNCGFQLGGLEAQKIDRLINAFAQCYFEDNAGDAERCPVTNEDSVYVLSFAILMLNTDLHKSASKQNVTKSMSKSDFIYNLKGADSNEEMTKDFLSGIYDAIDANPIIFDDAVFDGGHDRFSEDLHRNGQAIVSLLRDFAVHDKRFYSMDDIRSAQDDAEIVSLMQKCFHRTWHHFHGVVNTGLEMAHLDPQGMRLTVEILLNELASSVCLDDSTPRSAFMNQLARLKAFEECRQGNWIASTETQAGRVQPWFLELEEACTSSLERRLWALRSVRQWTETLHSALAVDAENREAMVNVTNKLRDGSLLLRDPARSFIRQGELLKKSSRTGRLTQYRFFLFSDTLLYASHVSQDESNYEIHGELPLHLMKIVDWYPPTKKNRTLLFNIVHPTKSFQAMCATPQDRKSWVSAIRAAITSDIDRKMRAEAARVAAAP